MRKLLDRVQRAMDDIRDVYDSTDRSEPALWMVALPLAYRHLKRREEFDQLALILAREYVAKRWPEVRDTMYDEEERERIGEIRAEIEAIE